MYPSKIYSHRENRHCFRVLEHFSLGAVGMRFVDGGWMVHNVPGVKCMGEASEAVACCLHTETQQTAASTAVSCLQCISVSGWAGGAYGGLESFEVVR